MRVLVAEDDSVTRQLLNTSLRRWQYEVTLAADGTHALEVLLGERPPRLAVLDWVMPGIDGVDICRELRKQDTSSYIYTLLVTSKSSREDLLTGLEAGADDYLIKPFDLMELQARLWSGQRIISLQDQLIAARDALREQATHDALTEVWNRAAILDILQRELNRSKREGSPLSVFMADIDHFKRINDTWGHQTGDTVLREVTRRMRAVIRSYDSLGRYGGEEFLVVAPGCTQTSALKLAEKLRGVIGESPIPTGESSLPVTLSLGVACIKEDSASETLVKRADEALYAAKRAGRNKYELAQP
jgi:diguanylate cyclase (GGDEF)-like protein